ncbi:NAD(P)H:quinone oxidoreductase [Candidatus Pacearchaeota archaeon]|nr:NAD(P)H:quinone oxidoreductase [Candidatus Pacearchaeota archaeon]
MEKPKILIVFYSMNGNTAKLAKALAEGAKNANAKIRLRQVQELIPEDKFNDVMKKTKEDLKDIPIASNDDLVWADGIAFGTPTRFGNVSAQLKQFIDQTGGLWMKGALINKVATVFTSVSTQHGGHETTIFTSWAPLIHHGMIIIGVPYSEQRLMSMELGGGGPYGASSVSSPNANIDPTKNDLEIAKVQGKRLAEVARKMM